MYVLLYLDDLIIASKKENEIIYLKRKLSNELEMKDLGKLKSFHSLEINQDREENILTISQEKYLTKLLKRFHMYDSRAVQTPMEPKVKEELENDEIATKPYKDLLGCLMYAMIEARPDLSASTSYLSRYQDK